MQRYSDGYVNSRLRLFKIDDEKDWVKEKERRKKGKSTMEPASVKLRFQLNQSFLSTRENAIKQLQSDVPVIFTEDDKVLGAVIYD